MTGPTAWSEAAAALATQISGRVSLPGDDAYEQARRTFNGMLERAPAIAVACADVHDVRRAVESASRAELPVSIRGGGHSVAGHGVGHESLLVDLSPMRQVRVDSRRGVVVVAGGALWEDVDSATQAAGQAVPGGTFGDTGVGGLTLGGGLGWLLGTAGLTCDNLVRAELVDAAGELRVASADDDSELLWALRGGGGNFGVVTSFELALHERGPMVGGYLTFAFEDTQAVLGALAELMHDAPDELVVMPLIRRYPELGLVCDVGIAFAGASAESEPLMSRLRGLGRLLLDDIAERSYIGVQEMNDRMPFGLRHYWKGHFLADLDASAITAMMTAIESSQGRCSILLEALSGKARRTDAGTAAFPARAARWNATALAIWEDPAMDGQAIQWARDAATAFEPSSLGGGGYVNYATQQEPVERMIATYGADSWARLVAVKQCCDPENTFRFNANIPPG